MKKLITLLSSLAFFSLIFVGCQSTEDITSPANLDKPAPVYNFSCDPTKISDETVDLIAGQHNPVGTATFHLTGAGLEITYQLDGDEIANGAMITVAHIDFALALNNDSKNGGFHANSSGNPQPGQFDLNVPFSPSKTNWSTFVSNEDLAKYLNPANPPASVPADFYIAAHGVVKWGGDGTCPTLPNGEWRWLTSVPGPNFYVEGAQLYDEANFNSDLLYDNLNGWCVDRPNGAKGGHFVQVDFLCSYGNDVSCYIDKPENVGAINWLINNKGTCGSYTMRDIQVAIWMMADTSSKPFRPYDTTKVDCLVAAALQHNDFVPGCGQVIGVLMFEKGVEYCGGATGGMQQFLIERPVQCGGEDTFWGFDWDFDLSEPLANASCRFVEQGNWARYFQF